MKLAHDVLLFLNKAIDFIPMMKLKGKQFLLGLFEVSYFFGIVVLLSAPVPAHVFCQVKS